MRRPIRSLSTLLSLSLAVVMTAVGAWACPMPPAQCQNVSRPPPCHSEHHPSAPDRGACCQGMHLADASAPSAAPSLTDGIAGRLVPGNAPEDIAEPGPAPFFDGFFDRPPPSRAYTPPASRSPRGPPTV